MNMKKIQAWVTYKVEVAFRIKDNATEQEIKKFAAEKANDEWKYNAEITDIEYDEY